MVPDLPCRCLVGCCDRLLRWKGTFGKGGYGFKASEKLSKVRGRDFRHEKTKKKRGNYRGGQISMASNSVKFDSD